MTTLMSAFPPDLQTRSVSHLMGLRRALFYLFAPADEKAYLPEEEVLEKV